MSRLLTPLAHVELTTPCLDESVAFLVDVMGMDVVTASSASVYLRCWGDYYHHSVVLTAADQPALSHAAWRARSPEALREAVRAIQRAGMSGEWIDATIGHGDAFRFNGPGGHTQELFWEVEHAQVPVGEESIYPERPQRPGTRGIATRFLDHVTVTTYDVRATADWYRRVLDFRFIGYIQNEPDGPVFFGTVTTNEKSHDLGLIRDPEGYGRLHHLAFWVETREDLLRGAKYLVEHGIAIEYGPGFHGIGEQEHLYFREPGGIRFEVNTGGFRNYVPDWEPVRWRDIDGPGNGYLTHSEMPAAGRELFPQDPRRAGLVVPIAAAASG